MVYYMSIISLIQKRTCGHKCIGIDNVVTYLTRVSTSMESVDGGFVVRATDNLADTPIRNFAHGVSVKM